MINTWRMFNKQVPRLRRLRIAPPWLRSNTSCVSGFGDPGQTRNAVLLLFQLFCCRYNQHSDVSLLEGKKSCWFKIC